MTIKPYEAISKPHHDLLVFMQDYGIKVKLAARLLKIKTDTMRFHRMGNRNFTNKILKELKKNFLIYMNKKLKTLKSYTSLVKLMKDFDISGKLAGKLLKCSANTVYRYCMTEGNRKFGTDKMELLKSRYEKLMRKQLDSIKI